MKVQGEILEGLVARIVSRDSAKHMEDVLKEFPPVAFDGGRCFEAYFVIHVILFPVLSI